ncbi:MAG: hypothetical protein OEY75_09200, partial [Hylemonella sp.]|nr:hypothetical protein [Hylemonella sp.]
QRPILATVHRNPQMAAMLREQGHAVVQTGETGRSREGATQELADALVQLFERWRGEGLADNGRISPYTTQAAVSQLLQFLGFRS